MSKTGVEDMQYRILIVEDDEAIAGLIERGLQRWGFAAARVKNFQNVMEEFEEFGPHLVLMDISLPFYGGFYWCDRIRRASRVPIVFLSCQSDNMSVVMAMNMGGDDFIAKPVDMDVLIAKINAMLRRSYDYKGDASIAVFCGAYLDLSASVVEKDGKRAELTRNEIKILSMLIENKNAIVERSDMMERLWDSEEFVDENTLSVNVNRLRRTLEAIGITGAIRTHKGRGYSLSED